MTTAQLSHGDARAVLARLPGESVHCVVTSPPYYGLRDYAGKPVVWGGDAECEHAWTQTTTSGDYGSHHGFKPVGQLC